MLDAHCMTRPRPLPETAREPSYRVGELREMGAGRKRLHARDMNRVAHGVVLNPAVCLDLTDVHDRCLAFSPALQEHHFYSRRTSAQLWGMPVSGVPGDLLEVGSPHPSRAPRREGVSAHRIRPGTVETTQLRGVRLAAPEDTWCLLAAVVGLDELIIAGDYVLSGARVVGGAGRRVPALCTPESLAAAVHRHRGTQGGPLRSVALGLLRSPVDSPAETRLRLLIVRSGFVEPMVNCPVRVAGRTLYADLGYPHWRIAIEFEGRYHFVGGEEQARRDVERHECMKSAGWEVLRVTARDLRDPRGFLGRLATAIAAAVSRVA